MNRHYTKKAFLPLCLFASMASFNNHGMQLQTMLKNTIEAAPIIISGAHKYIIPAAIVAGAGLCMTLKAMATRYLKLGAIQASLNPTLSLEATAEDQSVYNWNIDTENFRSVSEINSHQQEVKAALIQACISGQVAVYKHDYLTERQTQGSITWEDLTATLDKEQKRLDTIKKRLDPFVDISFQISHCRFNFFGIKKNFKSACSSIGIRKIETITQEQETQLSDIMTQDRGWFEKGAAFLMFNPNYNKAYKLYWQVCQRCERLKAIIAACVTGCPNAKALITKQTGARQLN